MNSLSGWNIKSQSTCTKLGRRRDGNTFKILGKLKKTNKYYLVVIDTLVFVEKTVSVLVNGVNIVVPVM